MFFKGPTGNLVDFSGLHQTLADSKIPPEIDHNAPRAFQISDYVGKSQPFVPDSPIWENILKDQIWAQELFYFRIIYLWKWCTQEWYYSIWENLNSSYRFEWTANSSLENELSSLLFMYKAK